MKSLSIFSWFISTRLFFVRTNEIHAGMQKLWRHGEHWKKCKRNFNVTLLYPMFCSPKYTPTNHITFNFMRTVFCRVTVILFSFYRKKEGTVNYKMLAVSSCGWSFPPVVKARASQNVKAESVKRRIPTPVISFRFVVEPLGDVHAVERPWSLWHLDFSVCYTHREEARKVSDVTSGDLAISEDAPRKRRKRRGRLRRLRLFRRLL